MPKKIILLILIGIIIVGLAILLVRKPEVRKPEIETSEIETPEMEKPEMEKPEMEKPEKDIVVTKTATLPKGRSGLACAENSATHKIYCFGGYYDPGHSVALQHGFNQIVEYDPATDTLTIKKATLPTKISGLACAENSASNKIYCFGGWYSNQIFEYDPEKDTLTIKKATLPTERSELACAENSETHKIYCFGGYYYPDWGEGGEPYRLNQILEYDPATDTLTIKKVTLPTARDALACAENSATHKIYCFGGGDAERLYNEIIEYDPTEDTLTTKTATLPTERWHLACAENSTSNKIYCFGGVVWSSGSLNQIVEYDPATDTLTIKKATLPTKIYSLACAENSASNKIYCLGGYGGYGVGSPEQIVEYSP